MYNMKKSVDIGIAVHNEEKNIGNLLNTLANQKIDYNIKNVFIVCSGCTDRSVSIVKDSQKKYTKIRLLLESERKGKYSAINKILRVSKADFLILINADTAPKNNSIKFLLEVLENRSDAVSGKPVCDVPRNSLAGYIQNFVWEYHDELSKNFPTITGEICGIRNKVINRIPEKVINDDEYLAAVISKKCHIEYVPRAETKIVENMTLGQFIKKRRRFAQGHFQINKMRKTNSPSI